ncbi:hypothetical protein ACFQ9X_46300 [Catenulispora yoronensis]
MREGGDQAGDGAVLVLLMSDHDAVLVRIQLTFVADKSLDKLKNSIESDACNEEHESWLKHRTGELREIAKSVLVESIALVIAHMVHH